MTQTFTEMFYVTLKRLSFGWDFNFKRAVATRLKSCRPAGIGS